MSSVAPIFETFCDAHDLDHFTLCPCLAVNVFPNCLRKELADHVWLGCRKRECRMDSVESGKLVVAFVFGVALDVKHYVQELLFGLCHISHNWE